MRRVVVALALASVVRTADAQRAVPSHAVEARRRPAPQAVTHVNGVPLMSDRLDAAVNSLIPLELFHRSVDPNKMAELRARALKDLVDQELEYQHGVRSGVRVAPPEIDAAVTRAKQRFKTPGAFEERLKASGATVADFRREVERSITIQKAFDRTVTAKCQVGADEAKRFFAANQDRFVVPEQLHVFAITFGVDPSANADAWANARARAESVRRQIQGGARFDEMARTHSTDASKATGGDMGFVHRGSLNDEFEQALRAVPLGQVSEVIKTLYGYHLVRVAAVRPPQKKTFAEVGPEIRKDLTATRCAELKDAWIARLRAAASITP
jgi:parvulin-like peptidyl-prolyl isomerase